MYLTKIAYGNYKDGTNEKFAFEVIIDYANADLHKAIKYQNNNIANAPIAIPLPNTPSPLTPRKDIIHDHRAGFLIKTQYLIRNIWIMHHFAEYDGVTHGIHFAYDENPVMSCVQAITQTGYKKQITGDKYTFKSTPPVDLSYSQFVPNAKPSYKTIHAASGEDLNLPLHFVDLEQEGLPGLLYRNADTVEYFTPTEGGFEAGKVLDNIPSGFADAHQAMNFVSLEGNGALQIAAHRLHASGYYEMENFKSTETIQWRDFQAFEKESINNLAYRTESADLSGDNRADQVIINPEEIIYIPSLGKQGMGQQQVVANTNKVDADNAANLEPYVYYGFADVFGDGLSHRVKVENQKITIWANLGYGQFGEAQTISISDLNVLEEHIDLHTRLQFADINGSGKADLVIAYPDRIKVFINQNGQAFAAPIEISLPDGESWSPFDTLQFADIEGTGNTYLVFSKNGTTVKHYYGAINQATTSDQLCNKAFLLHKFSNNMGAENQLFYKSSLQDYLADKKAGKPWDTKMHSPVMVIDHSITIDHISETQITSQFKYRNGYYDPIEHQFLGFAYVEHIDTPKNQVNANDSSTPPPTISKQWFHLGRGILEEENVTQSFFKSKLPTLQRYIDDKGKVTTELSEIPEEALFALVGSEIHHEVWDGSQSVDTPFSMHTAAYTVVETATPSANKKGIYKVYGHESMAVDYEKVADDPHVTHEFTLEVDQYNHPLKACAVAYPRVKPIIPQQGELHITAHISVYQHQDEATKPRWLGIDIEDKSFEVTGLKPQHQYFTFDEIKTEIDTAFDNTLNYSDATTADEKQARLLSWQRHFYWANELQEAIWQSGEALPAILLLHHHESIELDNTLIKAAFAERLDASEIENAGYYFNENYWWSRSAVAYYLPTPESFYALVLVSYDWMEADHYLNTQSRVSYDVYWMFPISSHAYLNGAVEISTHAEMDYRVLHPHRITDANGNIAEALFDELGEVIATAHYGTEQEKAQGDAPLSQYQLLPASEHNLDDILVKHPEHYLQQAGSFHHYDFAQKDSQGNWLPAYSLSLGRTVYQSIDPEKIQRSIGYTDGFGRTIEHKQWAGSGSLSPEKPDKGTDTQIDNRWLASGRVSYNAKGHPEKSYLGYYSDTWQHQADWEAVIKPQLPKPSIFFYDALDRQIQAIEPKGYITRVEYPNAWEQRHFDQNDTKKDSPFYNTPAIALTDTLGHAVLSIQLQKAITPETKTSDLIQEAKPDNADVQVTAQYFDIEGRVIKQADPRFFAANQQAGNTENHQYNFRHLYAISHAELYSHSTDAGEQRSFHDVHGNLVFAWDALENRHVTDYDKLQRPITQRVKTQDWADEKIVSRTVYGDYVSPDDENWSYGNVLDEAQQLNRVGKVWKQYDSAGLVTIPAYTFDGHPVMENRTFCEDYKTIPDWSQQTGTPPALEKQDFSVRTTFDAAGRPVQRKFPDNSEVSWQYGVMGNCIASDFKHGSKERAIITHSELDANGHLVGITYGNGINTLHEYDPETLALTLLASQRSHEQTPFQALRFTHDPTGLILSKTDECQSTVYSNNQQISAKNTYTYDALYRLTQATGRQLQAIGQSKEKSPAKHGAITTPFAAADLQAVSEYTESYQFDLSNNLTRLQRRHGNTNTSRNYRIASDSNRITAYNDQVIEYDAAGQMKYLNQNGSVPLFWNYHGNIDRAVLVERESGKDDDIEYYVYDHQGMRVRKVTETLGNEGVRHLSDKRYVGEFSQLRKKVVNREQQEKVIEERYRITVGGVEKHDAVLEYYQVRASQDQSADIGLLTRFQHGDQLGSVTIETNAEAAIITYEEYSPFGETVYSWVARHLEISPKEYRYSAQEKDGSTGLYYYGYRYYAPWLCRWTRPDPAGTIDGLNVLAFLQNSSIEKVDVKGLFLSNLTKRPPNSSSSHKMKKKKKGTANKKSTSPKKNKDPLYSRFFNYSEKKVKENIKDVYGTKNNVVNIRNDRNYQLLISAPGLVNIKGEKIGSLPSYADVIEILNHNFDPKKAKNKVSDKKIKEILKNIRDDKIHEIPQEKQHAARVYKALGEFAEPYRAHGNYKDFQKYNDLVIKGKLKFNITSLEDNFVASRDHGAQLSRKRHCYVTRNRTPSKERKIKDELYEKRYDFGKPKNMLKLKLHVPMDKM